MTKEDYFFVDEKQNIYTGDEAKKKLESVSDAEFLSEKEGIVKVSKERWLLAQDYEKHYWMVRQPLAADDRNKDHQGRFDNYNFLRGLKFKNAIELGCGPFTNLRLIGDLCKINECSLLDPLINSYFDHTNCTYKNRKNIIIPKKLYKYLAKSYPLRVVRKILNFVLPVSLFKEIPIKEFMPKPIEEMDTSKKYDLVVMLNVLEHCYDINLIFENIMKISNENTIFIFHDKFFDHKKVSNQIKNSMYEAGHPLLADKSVIENFLDKNFDPLYRKEEIIQHEVNGYDLSYGAIFFAGKIKK